MRVLYSAVKVRRLGWATTSGSGRETGANAALTGAAAALRSGSLRSPSLGFAAAQVPEVRRLIFLLSIFSFFFLALLIN